MIKLEGLDEELQKEMSQYIKNMTWYLPIENRLRDLKRAGKTLDEIKSILGEDSSILTYVPQTLYHGSIKSLDVISSRESTQKGSYVYATDNPIHALMFSIFRNSSVARGHIFEYLNDDGEYRFKIEVDERVLGALDEIINDRVITIHVVDGDDFFKPSGEAYINREWVSKEGQDIVPLRRIAINVKDFFDALEKLDLVQYSKYDKSKDWKTIMDMLGKNYPFGLGTQKGADIDAFDKLYDDFIGAKFPEQLPFSIQFRSFVKKVMAMNMDDKTPEEEMNYKLKYIRETADSFIKTTKGADGKILYQGDMDKITSFQVEDYFPHTNKL